MSEAVELLDALGQKTTELDPKTELEVLWAEAQAPSEEKGGILGMLLGVFLVPCLYGLVTRSLGDAIHWDRIVFVISLSGLSYFLLSRSRKRAILLAKAIRQLQGRPFGKGPPKDAIMMILLNAALERLHRRRAAKP